MMRSYQTNLVPFPDTLPPPPKPNPPLPLPLFPRKPRLPFLPLRNRENPRQNLNTTHENGGTLSASLMSIVAGVRHIPQSTRAAASHVVERKFSSFGLPGAPSIFLGKGKHVSIRSADSARYAHSRR